MKKFKKNISLIILGMIVSATTCVKEGENCHKSIRFKNQGDRDVYVSCSFGYPDTLNMVHGKVILRDHLNHKVKANTSSTNPINFRYCWEEAFGTLITSDTLMVFVFDAEVLETNEWSTVIIENMILRRYDLSLADIRDLNWQITYP